MSLHFTPTYVGLLPSWVSAPHYLPLPNDYFKSHRDALLFSVALRYFSNQQAGSASQALQAGALSDLGKPPS